ncbi:MULTISPECIES: DUF7693 family protein [Pseudomonas]|jgi:hypothetical protein|uniref:DUF7693 domain-containing protein n=1 Tax=Pseudomonas urmiensis TaxID=2745493 RepID=A0A923FV70_9PSED|nr:MULTISPECIES: hypothetical protein [Pseudomonas]MBV4535865.1 hypothetical protein [Pseudomonas urmiensis]
MDAPTSREVYQCLRDAALGVQPVDIRARHPSGQIEIESGGWQLTLVLDREGLAHCLNCRSPQGVEGSVERWQRYGTNPVDLLSLWERTQIERLLAQA